MKNRIVTVPPKKKLITRSPGFSKKFLADDHLDLSALCGFGCSYCSSNHGNYLRIRRNDFAQLTKQQLGERAYPADDPTLMFVWPDVAAQLERELEGRPADYGEGRTLVVSMLTDAFAPELETAGITRRVLKLVVERTRYRIRVLTKSAVVGRPRWITFFMRHRNRFVVGLSTGTLDDAWADRVEVGTSRPTARLRALRMLQDVGVPTFGMLCPVFPGQVAEGRLDNLVNSIRPHFAEHVWAEPFNDRTNWQRVRAGFAEGSEAHDWLTDVYENGNRERWSRYAALLYWRLREKAAYEGWLDKLRFLLYEDMISAADAPMFDGLAGVLLQSKPGADGLSRNPHVRALQVASQGSRP